MKIAIMIYAIPLLLSGAGTVAGPVEYSTARCNNATLSGPCELSWNFSATPRLQQSLQRLDPADGRWRVIDASDNHPVAGSRPVPGGSLYKMAACNGRRNGRMSTCVSSTVVWSPVVVPVEQIPAEVVDADGQVMTIFKSGTPEEQLEQYNVYLLIRLLSSPAVRLADLPPMAAITEQDVWADGDYTAAEVIQRSVYLNYSGMQRIAKARTIRGDAILR